MGGKKKDGPVLPVPGWEKNSIAIILPNSGRVGKVEAFTPREERRGRKSRSHAATCLRRKDRGRKRKALHRFSCQSREAKKGRRKKYLAVR